MNELVTITNTNDQGHLLSATFNPYKGMNLMSYTASSIQVISQSTKHLFETRAAGLGALIGPHFHQQPNPPQDFDFDLFDHIKAGIKEGRKDPFSHGIARYVPWKYTHSTTQIEAHLDGSMLYKGIPLSTFEGQDFHMRFNVRLLPSGLFITYSIESEKPSTLGFHYYYNLNKEGSLHINAEPQFRENDQLINFDKEILSGKHLNIDLAPSFDISLFPRKEPIDSHDYKCRLITPDYDLHLHYSPEFEHETCVQLYKDSSNSFVCIEPLSAKNPKQPHLTRSLIELKLEIFPR